MVVLKLMVLSKGMFKYMAICLILGQKLDGSYYFRLISGGGG